MKVTHVLVEGLVQGVSFREHTRRQAFVLQLNGWVRNLSNGAVEAVVCGPTDKVAEMLLWLRRGSPRSRVDNLKVQEVESDERFSNFEIRF